MSGLRNKGLSLVLFIVLLFVFSCHGTGKISAPSGESEGLKVPIVIYGDSRTNHEIHREIMKDISSLQPEMVFSTGDLVENGNVSSQWDTFMQILSILPEGCRFYPAIGNHEAGSTRYFELFELPGNGHWYTVQRREITFFILDTNMPLAPESEQYIWLKKELERCDTNFKIAIFHHPPFSSGPHVEDEKNLRTSIVPLFEQFGVQAVFNGHDHDYERSMYNGTFYIVTGGGGAPLYDQSRDNPYSQVFIKAYHFCALIPRRNQIDVLVLGKDLKEIDRFRITHGRR